MHFDKLKPQNKYTQYDCYIIKCCVRSPFYAYVVLAFALLARACSFTLGTINVFFLNCNLYFVQTSKGTGQKFFSKVNVGFGL